MKSAQRGMQKYSVRESAPDGVRAELISYPEFLQDMLYTRGILSRDAAEVFLAPDYTRDLHDPFLMRNMARAVSRILGALQAEERIAIYSDYDCDGIPGGVLLHDFFKKIGYTHFTNYIPHRHEEGYGFHAGAVEELALCGTTLIITVDCGTNDTAAAFRAKELGVEVIVVDHHLPSENPAQVYALLNPKQVGETYPFKLLCGSGVAFKLVQGLLAEGSASWRIHKGWEKWLLDMAGLGTLADMVPLTGENRALAYFGLAVLKKSPRLGLMKLCRLMRVVQREFTEDDAYFMLVPRINAASRMDAPMEAFRLLTTEEETVAASSAAHLNRINDERKGVVASMVKEIRKRVTDRPLGSVVVAGDPRWKPSLLGLAANTLAEEYERPVFLWGREGTMLLKGSCRSGGSVSVFQLMESRRELFIEFGGHQFAGGFSVAYENVHLLELQLSESFLSLQTMSLAPEKTAFDRELSLEDVNWNTYRHIARLAPFGEGNPKPLWLFRNALIENVRLFGKEKQHLELSFARQKGKAVSAIKFFAEPNDFDTPIAVGASVDLLATIERSTFRNFPELRLRIVALVTPEV